MTDYNQGANDVLIGANLANASIGLFNRIRQNQQEAEIKETFDDLQQGAAESIAVAVKWRLRAERAEKINKKWAEHAHDLEDKLTRTEGRLKEVESQKDELKESSDAWTKSSRTNRANGIKNRWRYNKAEAMRVALHDNIEELFEEQKVDYPKDKFDQEVNEQYIKERLTLDQNYYNQLLETDDRFPDDEYVDHQKERISGQFK